MILLADTQVKQQIKTEKEAGYDADDEEVEHKPDTELMPPPPVPEDKEALTPEEAEAAAKRKLETPLASMLPSKYANVNVTELFPDFRPHKVLRFSKLFGPGKPSSLPQIWRGVRKRRKRKRHQDLKDSDSGSDQDNRKPKFRVIKNYLNYCLNWNSVQLNYNAMIISGLVYELCSGSYSRSIA